MVKVPGLGEVPTLSREDVVAVLSLPQTLARLNRALVSFGQTVDRMDRLVRRIDRLTEPLEAPMAGLADRLQALVELLDHEAFKTMPDVLTGVQRTAVPALDLVVHTQAQVATLAASVERLVGTMDQLTSWLPDLPGSNLVARWRSGAGRPPPPPER
ncbi:MAG: hypothetical protein ACYC1D_14985 [Acidimicrobiales bacterium]